MFSFTAEDKEEMQKIMDKSLRKQAIDLQDLLNTMGTLDNPEQYAKARELYNQEIVSGRYKEGEGPEEHDVEKATKITIRLLDVIKNESQDLSGNQLRLTINFMVAALSFGTTPIGLECLRMALGQSSKHVMEVYDVRSIKILMKNFLDELGVDLFGKPTKN